MACGGDRNDNASEEERRGDAQPTASAATQAVLAELAALGAQPINTLTVAQARTQPTPGDAVRSVLTRLALSTAPEAVGSVTDSTFAGPAGAVPIRIYKPAGAGPFPVILYIHGGGWVIATIDTYDSSARALTHAAGAIVVSTHYRQAPEAPFPAAHEDTWAAWQWTVANAVALGGNARQVAVVGESAGGNMAASIAIRARDTGTRQPVHQTLIYPVIDAVLDSPSEQQNRDAQPLNTASLAWFYEKYLAAPTDAQDPRFAVGATSDLRGVAPATVILADIDPLRSEGRQYAERLSAADVRVDVTTYAGVTHEFFGMGALVTQSRTAVDRVGRNLQAAFAANP
jgi:acetyl esterase/lipase